MYSKAASVILEHQLRSKERSLGKFSAINSTPSSVTLLHPESDSTVRLGKECTKTKTNILINISKKKYASEKALKLYVKEFLMIYMTFFLLLHIFLLLKVKVIKHSYNFMLVFIIYLSHFYFYFFINAINISKFHVLEK